MERKGEKFGWIGGWLGGSLFMPAMGGILLAQHQLLPGIILLVSFVVLLVLTFIVVPWRFPFTCYWKLLLPFYAVFLIGGGATVWTVETGEKISPLLLLCLLPCLMPFYSIGKRTWNIPADPEE